MVVNVRRRVLAALVLTASLAGPGLRECRADGDAARGAVVFALAGGCGCHTPQGGPVGAGGRELPTPFGTFYGTNITPDPETGIGDWSDEEIIAAIRRGEVRGKGVEAPVMPYPLYAGMAERDVNDLVAYLRKLPPVVRENKPPSVNLPFQRLAYAAWRLLFVRAIEAPVDAPIAGIERGRYLAENVSICGDCHTPRNLFGALRADMYLAGTADGPDGHRVPNITPDVETGLGKWDVSDITQLLQLGMKPDFDNVQGLMAEVIDGYGGGPGYGKAPEADLKAIAAYLKTIKAIRNRVSSD